jgi:hypothetical protein
LSNRRAVRGCTWSAPAISGADADWKVNASIACIVRETK